MVQRPPAFLGPGSSEVLYDLEELIKLAGERLGEAITPRTVRLYATEGLIDRPGKDGRRAIYNQRHLLQLLLIRSLARRGLSLSAIAPLVVGSDAELKQQWRQLDESVQLNPAAEPINDAVAYLQRVRADPSGESEAPASLFQQLGTPLRARSPSLRTSRMSGRSASASSRWHRFSLAPGVELHLNESASVPPPGDRRDAWLERLSNRLREQLENQE